MPEKALCNLKNAIGAAKDNPPFAFSKTKTSKDWTKQGGIE